MASDESNPKPTAGAGQLRAGLVIHKESREATVSAGHDLESRRVKEAAQLRQEDWPVATAGGSRGSMQGLGTALGTFRVSFHTRTQFCSAERVYARRPSARDGWLPTG